MPFKRCASCGKEFLAHDDSQDICRPDCAGPQVMELEAKRVEGTWWHFPLFFLCCCIATYMIYDNAYDVELYLVRNVSFMREPMARKLAESCPESIQQFIDGVADQNVEVSKACLDALVDTGKELPTDNDAVFDLVAEIKAIYEDPNESVDLKQSAVAALGAINDKEVVDILYRALNDKRFVKGAVLAMKKVGSERAIEPIIDIVIDEHNKYQVGDVRYHAVIVLGLIKDNKGRAIPALIKALRDPSGPVRDEALTALKLISTRYKELSLSARDDLRKSVVAIRKFLKSDRIFSIRERSKQIADEMEQEIR